ncbi:MAG: DUF1848 domain-containing protein [Pseudomonadota bacterium]
MIVSASYRTDIPAFYADWFRRRLAEGYALVANPYGGPPYRVDLRPEAVTGFVFWTRNPRPFLPVLEELAAAGRPFYLQFTITGYPRALERAVPAPGRAVAAAQAIAERFGPKAVVWRYDPVLWSDLTETAWHIENFQRLARTLEGSSDEVVLSAAQIYAKTRRNLDAAARRHAFGWRDPEPAEKTALLGRLAMIAAGHGMRAALCAQPELSAAGLEPARCVDAERLAAIAGRPIAAREKGNRPGCFCAESRDIGAYDTCPHGCVYCYAVGSETRARARHRAHDPASPFLAEPAVMAQ